MRIFESILNDLNNAASIVTAIASVIISLVAYKFNKREFNRDLAKDLKECRDKFYSSYDAWFSDIREGKEESDYSIDTFKSSAVNLINSIEASSTVQPQLTNWLHALEGQMVVVSLMRSRLRDWPQKEDLADNTKWASALMNMLLDIVKDSITPLTLEADETDLLEDDFWLVLDNPVLISGKGKAKPTIDPVVFEEVRKKWISTDIKNSEQRLRLQTLVDYKVIAENSIAFILYGKLLYSPDDWQERFEMISENILGNLFERFSNMASKQINAILD